MVNARTIVVGDIHGCFDELQDLLALAKFSERDRVIAVGDLIVKGPKNREVLELFLTDARFSAVLGNHDRALLRFWRGEDVKLKPSQKRARKELKPDRERYLAYLESLPYLIELGSHIIVHAGLRPNVPLSAQSVDDLTELRTLGPDRASRDGEPWYQQYHGESLVLFGHWPAAEPRRGPCALGLDTGCVYGHRLTAYILETKELLSVPARTDYDPPKRSLVKP